jgi:hypothetical protein
MQHDQAQHSRQFKSQRSVPTVSSSSLYALQPAVAAAAGAAAACNMIRRSNLGSSTAREVCQSFPHPLCTPCSQQQGNSRNGGSSSSSGSRSSSKKQGRAQ